MACRRCSPSSAPCVSYSDASSAQLVSRSDTRQSDYSGTATVATVCAKRRCAKATCARGLFEHGCENARASVGGEGAVKGRSHQLECVRVCRERRGHPRDVNGIEQLRLGAKHGVGLQILFGHPHVLASVLITGHGVPARHPQGALRPEKRLDRRVLVREATRGRDGVAEQLAREGADEALVAACSHRRHCASQ